MTTELAVREHSVAEIETMAKQVGRSGLFGMNESQAFTLMCLAQAKGIHPIQAVERYHVISGKPAMKADAILADFQRAGGTVEWTTRTDLEVAATFTHPVHAPKGVEVSFTMQDAKRAQLTGNKMWEKYPQNMMRARVISNGVRLVMPGILLGLYTPEEVSDFEPSDRAPVQVQASVVENPTTNEGIKDRRAQEAAERKANGKTTQPPADDRERQSQAAKDKINKDFAPNPKVKWDRDRINAWITEQVAYGNDWWADATAKKGLDLSTWRKEHREPFNLFRIVGHLCKFLEKIVPAREGIVKADMNEKIETLALCMDAYGDQFEAELERYIKKEVPQEIKAQRDEAERKAAAKAEKEKVEAALANASDEPDNSASGPDEY